MVAKLVYIYREEKQAAVAAAAAITNIDTRAKRSGPPFPGGRGAFLCLLPLAWEAPVSWAAGGT